MRALSKLEKFMIVISLLWETFCLSVSTRYPMRGGSYIKLEEFFLSSLPVILYWSGVWIFGRGYIGKAFSYLNSKLRIKSLLKKVFSAIALGIRVLIKIFLLLCILLIINYIATFEAEDKQNINVTNTNAEQVIYDYSSYYGLFIWQDNFCYEKGVKLTNLDILRNKYRNEIINLENEMKQLKDDKGRNIFNMIFAKGHEHEIVRQKGLEGFNFIRKMMIVDKLFRSHNQQASNVLKNMSVKESIAKYGYLVSEKEVCSNYNESLSKEIKNKDSTISQMLKFFEKYQ